MTRALARQWLAETLEQALLRLDWRLVAEIRGARCDTEVRVHALWRATP